MPRTHRQHCAFTQNQVAELVRDSLQPLGQCRSLVGKVAISEKYAKDGPTMPFIYKPTSLVTGLARPFSPQPGPSQTLSHLESSTLIFLSFSSSSPSDPWAPLASAASVAPPPRPHLQFPWWPTPPPQTTRQRPYTLPQIPPQPSYLASPPISNLSTCRGGQEVRVEYRPKRGQPEIGEQGCGTPGAYSSRACVLTHHRSFRCWGRSLSDR